MPTPPDIPQVLERLDRIATLAERLIRSHDLANRQEVAELLLRQIALAKQALQPPNA